MEESDVGKNEKEGGKGRVRKRAIKGNMREKVILLP